MISVMNYDDKRESLPHVKQDVSLLLSVPMESLQAICAFLALD